MFIAELINVFLISFLLYADCPDISPNLQLAIDNNCSVHKLTFICISHLQIVLDISICMFINELINYFNSLVSSLCRLFRTSLSHHLQLALENNVPGISPHLYAFLICKLFRTWARMCTFSFFFFADCSSQ